MNHDPHQPDNDAIEREWQAQERAWRAERLGLDTNGDAHLLRYRLVAHALRQPLDQQLPLDFAHDVAALAHAQARRHKAADMRIEKALSYVLLGILMIALVALIIAHGHEWLRASEAVLPPHMLSNPWLLMLVGCVVLSRVLEKFLPARLPTSR
ncbi:hypothetical protein [Dyella subtropica]|uniref:hypothetical protein n=1 Tax=Dyella subtropica TaxID=2992127 RepID=UPI00224CF0E6|nr:hypothetical protein [Dyella subtropica]